MKSTLFLHMGPGLNAHVERQVLSAHFPEVHFWDQPAVLGPGAFDQLVQSALAQVESMYQSTQRPVKLMAHSFGGQLARAIIGRRPELIGDSIFYNAGYCPATAFYRLLRRLGQDAQTPGDLKQDIAAFLKLHPQAEINRLWDYVTMVVRDANFMRLYWAKQKHFEHYVALSAGGPTLLFQTFQDVLNDFYLIRRPAQRLAWSGRVRLEMGDQDPLIDVQADASQWGAIFANLHLVVQPDSGHYSHLEPYFD
ncbi:MAG: alpha/beta fold hydrolase [Bdellovibrionales bacterium]